MPQRPRDTTARFPLTARALGTWHREQQHRRWWRRTRWGRRLWRAGFQAYGGPSRLEHLLRAFERTGAWPVADPYEPIGSDTSEDPIGMLLSCAKRALILTEEDEAAWTHVIQIHIHEKLQHLGVDSDAFGRTDRPQ